MRVKKYDLSCLALCMAGLISAVFVRGAQAVLDF